MKTRSRVLPVLFSLLIAAIFLLTFLFGYSVVVADDVYRINGEPMQTPAVIISGHSDGGGLANP